MIKSFFVNITAKRDRNCSDKPSSSDKSVVSQTYRDDVIFAESQFIIIMAFKVKQGLGTAAAIARHINVVLQVKGMTLHAVVCLQVLHRHKKVSCKMLLPKQALITA